VGRYFAAMHSGKFVLAQLLDWIHPQQFQRCVTRYGGDYKVRCFSCWDQFLCLAFAQLTYRESLRDIEACLRSRRPQLYHLGLRGEVSRATLADANEARDWRIYAELTHGLIRQARQLYASDDLGVELEQTAYALDATTIDLCLSLFPWARFRRTKGAVKMHTLLDLRGNIPTTVCVSEGRTHEVNWLDQLAFESNAIYIMDRGYLDFARLYAVEQAQAFFVIRAKERLNYCRLHSHPVATDTGLRSDQTISLSGFYPAKAYPDKLRRVRFYDVEQERALVFLTNHFALPALTVSRLDCLRWRVELFFKWIKQHLRIKAFYGTSPNAVRTQLWIAVCVYVLVAIIRKQLKIEASMFTILQILSVNAFDKTPLPQLLAQAELQTMTDDSHNQLLLFNQ
jgi:uncharacterized protein DUF4372/DDE family transposase